MARSKGALIAYARAFASWMNDDSADLSKTMATLDKFLKTGEKALHRAEKIAGMLPRMGKRCRTSRRGTGAKKHHTETVNEETVFSDGPSVDDGSTAPMPS